MEKSARRIVLATVLLVQPALQLAEQASDPQVGATGRAAGPAAQVVAITAHPNQRLVSVLLGLTALVLFVPLVLGLRRLLRSRSPRLADVGTGLCMTGAAAFAALHGMDLATLAVLQVPGGNHVAAFAAIQGSPADGPLTAVFLFGMMVGMLLIAVGLWHTRTAPRPAAALLVAFLVLDFLAAFAGSRPLTLLAHGALWLGSGWIAVAMLHAHGMTAATVDQRAPAPVV